MAKKIQFKFNHRLMYIGIIALSHQTENDLLFARSSQFDWQLSSDTPGQQDGSRPQ